MNNKKYLAPLFLAFLCWGSVYVVSKVALLTIPPVTLLALRYTIAVPTLFLLLKLRGVIKPLKKEHMGTVFAIGFSHITCLSASKAATVISQCERLGVQTCTTSIVSSLRSSL